MSASDYYGDKQNNYAPPQGPPPGQGYYPPQGPPPGQGGYYPQQPQPSYQQGYPQYGQPGYPQQGYQPNPEHWFAESSDRRMRTLRLAEWNLRFTPSSKSRVTCTKSLLPPEKPVTQNAVEAVCGSLEEGG
ncbi:hypothetical protein C0989_001533 [Termitomyces sp. Mn162]|nr:hypothetical protein C0989_001533 [Termitomyces sp. Mn162]